MRGVSVFAGYRNAPRETAAAFDHEGFYLIGDAGYLVDAEQPDKDVVFNSRVGYDFGHQLSDLNVAVGVKNILNHEYYTRSFDDNNKGKYVGEPRTLYVQTSVAF